MKIISYTSAVLVGALCLTFGSIASAAEQKSPTSKSKASGKSTVVAQPAQPDVVIWVKTTGSLIPQRYIVRNGQIINTANNTQMLLLNELASTPSTTVAGILANNVPDITFTRR